MFTMLGLNMPRLSGITQLHYLSAKRPLRTHVKLLRNTP